MPDHKPIKLVLPRSLESSLLAGHPWIYRTHVPPGFRAAGGAWVEISAGSWRGYALWDERSPIALRVFSQCRIPTPALIAERVALAFELRQPLREAGTTAYRWIHGEGDELPGIVVDLYGEYAVVVTYADALEGLVPWVVQALNQATALRGILRRSRGGTGSGNPRLAVLQGERPRREVVVDEAGVRLLVDVDRGQKTGLFLDQRDNRRTVQELAAGRTVLNLFAYTGGFTVRAALGGATHVTSVDIAADALEATRANLGLNGQSLAIHELCAQDAVDFLEEARRTGKTYDLVVCDPPSFARKKAHLAQALRAYARVNALAIAATKPLGLYAAASCTAQVSPAAFREMLAEASAKAGRRLQIIHEAGHPLDHPILAHHLEGRYLKFIVGRILPIP